MAPVFFILLYLAIHSFIKTNTAPTSVANSACWVLAYVADQPCTSSTTHSLIRVAAVAGHGECCSLHGNPHKVMIVIETLLSLRR